MRFLHLVVLLAGVAAAAPAYGGEFPDSWYYPRTGQLRELEGKRAPDLTLGRWFTPQVSLKGKVVVVDFWGTWCPPCRAAIPHNNEIVKRYGDKGVVVMGVHDHDRGVDKIPQVIRESNIQYPVAVDNNGASQRAWKVSFWPTYAVVDTGGIVRAVGLQPGSVEKVVARVLGEATPEAPQAPPGAGAGAGTDEARWLEGEPGDRERFVKLLGDGKPPALRPQAWLAGDPVELEALSGRVVLLAFWTPAKPECLRLLRELAALHHERADQGLVIIAIASTSDRADASRLDEQREVPFRAAIDPMRATARRYLVDGFPDCFLIDRSGRLRLADVREDALDEAVAHLLAEKPPEANPGSGKG